MGPAHFAIGLAAKPAVPKAPLWILLIASEVLDLLCFGFVAADIEHLGISSTSIDQGVKVIVPGLVPWSHGLLMSVVWSIIAAVMAYIILREGRASGMVGLVVFSHWLLDFIVHPADLPILLIGSPSVGLGLWTTGPGLILSGVLEITLLAGGTAIYIMKQHKKTPMQGQDHKDDEAHG
jgi:hypothetical protein